MLGDAVAACIKLQCNEVYKGTTVVSFLQVASARPIVGPYSGERRGEEAGDLWHVKGFGNENVREHEYT